MLVLIALFFVLGSVALAISIHAISKGPDYISATNFGWSERYYRDAFKGRPVSKIFFRATPLALMIVFAWSGYSVFFDLFWVLGDVGFYDRRDGDWSTYRSIIAGSLGAPLGLAFAFWLIKQCEKLTKQNTALLELSGEKQIKKIVFGEYEDKS